MYLSLPTKLGGTIVSKIVIFEKDDLRIFDKLSGKTKTPTHGPIGWVEVFLRHQKVFEGNNLVVAQGREFVAQKIFNVNAYDGGIRPDLRNYKISHFAIGSGGATASGSSYTLLGPYICDSALNEPVQLGNTSYLNEPSNYDSGDGIHIYTDSVKPIITDGEILLEPDDYGGGACTKYTKVKCVCSIPAGEPSVILSGESVQVSEAGLYFVETTTQDVKMFSHICFPPKWKEKESDLTINWYILC
jgi:hypothetical protein